MCTEVQSPCYMLNCCLGMIMTVCIADKLHSHHASKSMFTEKKRLLDFGINCLKASTDKVKQSKLGLQKKKH